MEKNFQEKAIELANTNPQAGLIYAVLDLAMAIRENGCELENIAVSHEKLAEEIGAIMGRSSG